MHRALIVLLFASTASAADWPEFRGPNGTGLYNGPKLVTEFGPAKNLAWSTPIPGKGWSSPIVVKGKIYLTTAVPTDGGQSLRALAIDAKTGAIDWNKELAAVDAATAGRQHGKNTYASATPVSDGERLFVHFGHMGTACYDFAGNLVWKRTDYKYAPVHGTGGSPILVGDTLVFSVDGADKQFVCALDKKTGDEKWKTDRQSKASKRFSFTTPQVIRSSGRDVIVSTASDFVAGYDPASGAEIWRAKYPAGGYSLIARPVVVAGKLIVQTGYDTAHLFALDPSGSGDISDKISWDSKKGAPHTPSPIGFGDEVYTVTDAGFLTCFDAKAGTIHWSERLAGKGYSCSPIIANGLLYIASEDGVCSVVEASKTGFKLIAKSELKEKTFATFAPFDGALFIRTESKLYRFEGK